MDIKRLLTGSVVGGIVLAVLGYVIWDMLFADFFAANAGSATGVAKDPQVVWAIALGSLCYAALLTLAIGCRAGSVTIMNGLKTGVVVSGLVWFAVDLTLYGVWNVSNLTAAIVDPVLEIIRAGISGAVIAAVLGKVASPQAVT